METALTSDAFSPELIFRGLKGNIIDYVISSYHVNVALILLYYYRPELQIHCDSYTNGSGKETFIHTHKLPKDGIYHAKFVLVTTTEACRLIIMTTNITEGIVKDCMNDYYIITVSKCKLMHSTEFTEKLYAFFDTFQIHLKSALLNYDWRGIQAQLLVSIPGRTSHGICWQSMPFLPKKPRGRATIRTASVMPGYDIRKVFHVKDITIEVLPDELLKNKQINMGLVFLDQNLCMDESGKLQERYKIVRFDNKGKPFHYKRYTIEYQGKKRKDKEREPDTRILVITSANMTRQAWGTAKYASVNAELGVAWISKSYFN